MFKLKSNPLNHLNLRFNEKNLIPVVVQDNNNNDVLMMAWMNKESIERSIAFGNMVYWSRSRNEFWLKGATSGNTQKLISLTVDCDRDCLLAKVSQNGPACHTGQRSCFYTSIS